MSHVVAPPSAVVPGEATRQYLAALAARKRERIDWSAAPPTYKRYPAKGRVVLPWREPSLPGDLLRGLLGVTRAEWAHGARTVRLKRPAPSGGALYPIEAYIALRDGLYHYDAAHHAVDLVRPGDHRPVLHAALARPPAVLPELVVVPAAVFWRNGFKYKEFAYRLQCQEIGVLSAQVLALGERLGVPMGVHWRFDDAACQSLLGLDPACEGVLGAFTCGTTTATSHVPAPTATTENHPPPNTTDHLPPSVADRLPLLTALHAAGAAPHPGVLPPAPPSPRGPVVRLPAPRAVRLTDGLARRGSPDNGFLPRPIPAGTLAAVLAHCAAGYPGDLPGTADAPVTVTPYVLVQRVTGIPAGAYRYDRRTGALVATGGTGDVRSAPLQPNTRLALPEAAAVVVPVGDQATGATAFGDRWYRLQQAEAGLVVHRAALAATAAGLTARIHSDGTNPVTDAALGLAGPLRSLSFLLLGTARPGSTVTTSLT
ncbi:SagB family peptide dehydrogenase [Saccharothrix sp.]|uniref:SagB family peptide dehydrogenase n=1 Tax=Saccharothrix sp. TaxID=1873460 RepID=UPI00281217BE|nr:SagB family peptide dehydrogenase [Saccharothrix sp.]